MTDYFRPIPCDDPCRPDDALALAGGPLWFDRAEHLTRRGSHGLIPVRDLPPDVADRLTAPRADLGRLVLDRPRVMGIVNATPDSFSDGGQFHDPSAAIAHGLAMAQAGADIIDVGGESTRPGAETVPVDEEIARIQPVIAGIRAQSAVPISIDTRKAGVARAAVAAGANLVNDVAGFTYDADLAPFCAAANLPVCVMHAQGDPATMQKNPLYDNVLLDVYDFLDDRLRVLDGMGIPRAHIAVDPGIGFGKTLEHNLTLLRGLSLFHGLGCAILLGVSRKKFIAKIGNAPEPRDRMPGSVAVALAGVAQGAQILRVHDLRDTLSALALWRAVQAGRAEG